jgi:hypothetical protein
MDKNPIRGGAERGERANDREAPMVEAQATYIGRSCGEGSRSYLGRPRLGPERATRKRSEESAEAVVAEGDRSEGPNGEESETSVRLGGKGPQMSRQLELPRWGRDEIPRAERSAEAPTATHGNERSGASEFPIRYFDELGVPRLAA